MLPLHSDDELALIGARLSESEALALLLVQIEPLATIERRYGPEAYQAALSAMLRLIRSVARESLPKRDVLVTVGRRGDTLLAFLFRPRSDRAFYTATLGELRERLTLELTDRGRHAVYPYFREPLVIGVGEAVALFNPNVKHTHQILEVVEIAVRDAELETRLRVRERGRQVLQLILGETLTCRYEPIVDLETRTPLGYEALTRGPEGSSLRSPDRLFAQAREVGLTFELDCLCRRVAFAHASCIPRGKKLFLNCLPASIADPTLRGDGLLATLEKYELSPEDLVLEISERESIENFAIFREVRDTYRELGVQIAVDDAGAGYASLEAIMEIAPDYLKADMTLVRGVDSDPPRREVLSGLSAVASQIGAQVIAEGIETQDEFRVVRELGIPFGQGYLFGAPIAGDS